MWSFVSRRRRALQRVRSPIRIWQAIVVIWAASLGASCRGGSTQDRPATFTCAGGCESNDWPTLVIGVVGTAGAADALNFSVRLSSGSYAATRGGCPAEFDTSRSLCSFSISTVTQTLAKRLHTERQMRMCLISSRAFPSRWACRVGQRTVNVTYGTRILGEDVQTSTTL